MLLDGSGRPLLLVEMAGSVVVSEHGLDAVGFTRLVRDVRTRPWWADMGRGVAGSIAALRRSLRSCFFLPRRWPPLYPRLGEFSTLDPKLIVQQGYDHIGVRYREWSGQSAVRGWFLEEVLAKLPPAAHVLELGCGPGLAAVALAASGCHYLGVDLSGVQLSLAREAAPTALFKQADFTQIEMDEASLDAVVAFFVFGNVPRAEHEPMFAKVFQWLRPGGWFMLSLPMSGNSEGVEDEFLGVPMFFAAFDRQTNDRHIVQAGFCLEFSEPRTEMTDHYGPETFQWVMARKSPG